MIAQNPTDPSNVVAAGMDHFWSDFNGSGYGSLSMVGLYSSRDAGRTWLDQEAPGVAEFFNNSSAECGHIQFGDTSVGFGPNGTTYLVDIVSILKLLPRCPPGYARTGIYVTATHDGGTTWNTPVAANGLAAGDWFDKPWVTVDSSTGEVYVAYSDVNAGWVIKLQNSTDGGLHWSSPISLSPTGLNWGVELVVDPTGGVDAAWFDQTTLKIWFSRSIDRGATFSTPVTIATAPTAGGSSVPDAFGGMTHPSLALGPPSSGNPTGPLYATWESGAGGAAGSPSVLLSSSEDNGSTWSTPTQVESNATQMNFMPSTAVSPDGTVYVAWVSEDPSSGNYRLAAAESHDGGQTFDPQFNVSDVDSVPSTAATGPDWWIGDYTHMAADTVGARPIWTDARSPDGYLCSTARPCVSYGREYNISLYTAQLVSDWVQASIPVNLTLTGGEPGSRTVNANATPTPLDWLAGASYNWTAPAAVDWNGSTWSFAYWYGQSTDGRLTYSESPLLHGLTSGAERFAACYVSAPGGTCSLAGAPGFLGVSVAPSTASVSIDGVTQTPTQNLSRIPEPPGVHWVNVSAPGFAELDEPVVVVPGAWAYANITLVSLFGNLVGSVSPSDAVVTVDGSGIPVAVDGSFALALPTGSHSVDAASPHYAPYANDSVVVRPAVATILTINLVGLPGWINGTVDPAFADVTVNGAALLLDAAGAFRAQLRPGTYWFNASAMGFLSGSSGPIILGPFGATTIALILTSVDGTLSGSVDPSTAAVRLNGSDVAVVAGNFSLELAPGDYLLATSAAGFDPVQTPFTIRSGELTRVAIRLNGSGGWLVGTVVPSDAQLGIDGVLLAISPNGSFNSSADPGLHSLVVTAPGFQTWSANETVRPGHATVVRIVLEGPASAPGTFSYVVPLLVGSAVVLAVLAVLFLLHRRSRRRGPTSGPRVG